VADIGGKLELFEAKWAEVPASGDTVNLDFVRNAVSKRRIARGVIVCRTPNGFPLANGIRFSLVTLADTFTISAVGDGGDGFAITAP